MMSSKERNTRLDSQFSRMYCQMFSTGFSSGHFRRQGQQGNVVRHGQRGGEMPARLVEEQNGVGAGGDGL